MSNLVLSILVSYIIYKESFFYLNYLPNIIKKEIREYLEDDNFMSNIYTRKNYNKKEIYKSDKQIQYEINDDLIIL